MTNESSRRPSQAKAEQAIRGFLIEVGQDPDYYHLVEDGDDNSAPGKCGWAWWQDSDDTTSYVHEDLTIEYYGPYNHEYPMTKENFLSILRSYLQKNPVQWILMEYLIEAEINGQRIRFMEKVDGSGVVLSIGSISFEGPAVQELYQIAHEQWLDRFGKSLEDNTESDVEEKLSCDSAKKIVNDNEATFIVGDCAQHPISSPSIDSPSKEPQKKLFIATDSGNVLYQDNTKLTLFDLEMTSIESIWGLNSKSVFAVGDEGKIFHFDGTDWKPMQSRTNKHLACIWGLDERNVFAVGSEGTILYYDGNYWTSMLSGVSVSLNAVWGIDKNNIFAVGDHGTILFFDGKSWRWMKLSSTKKHLDSVWGTWLNNVFAVGAGGTILHYDGLEWAAERNMSKNDLYCVWGVGPNNVFVVGEHGTVFHYNNEEWRNISTGTTEDLRSVHGIGSDNVFFAGCNETLLHYNNITLDNEVALKLGFHSFTQFEDVLTFVD